MNTLETYILKLIEKRKNPTADKKTIPKIIGFTIKNFVK